MRVTSSKLGYVLSALCLEEIASLLRQLITCFIINIVHVKVDRVVVHPKYNPNTIDNDIALLKLRSSDMKTNGGYYLQPACLPVSDFLQRKRKPVLCVVIGWGKIHSQDSYGSHVLREARVCILISNHIGNEV